MDRSKALQQLLAVNSTPKQTLESTPSDRNQSGMTYTPAYTGRVRDRATIAEKTKEIVAPKPATSAQQEQRRWADAYTADYERRKFEDAARARKKAEQRDLDQRRKWKIENDAKTRKEIAERTVSILFANDARAEVRSLLAEESPEVILEVSRRVQQAKMQNFIHAWSAFLEDVN